jgi:hypothetical protein
MSDGGLVRTIGVGNHNYKVAFSPDGQFIAGASCSARRTGHAVA